MLKRILSVLLFFALAAAVAPSLDKAHAAGKTYYVNIDSGSLNVRKAPSTRAAIITRLTKGKALTVYSQSKGWARVSANGKQGYVSSSFITTRKPAAPSSNYRTKAVAIAKSNLGVRYRYGGTSPSGFDCSGFVGYSYKKAGKSLPRTASQMASTGRPVSSLSPGDLMFYATGAPGRVSHVAIYIGNGKMIHSATSYGVSIASTSNSYWKPRYLGAKRI
ncbi:C40 family peptidase [Bacillus massilinigeriensis]|uniref:C40 family peptidase n=1 Tax=Bacillus mediterraneensis TaxID=1805474 RepID=UPI0013565F91|nr:SH3 domain-containing C40 family peptidase [Bacillus mediterraneensis]